MSFISILFRTHLYCIPRSSYVFSAVTLLFFFLIKLLRHLLSNVCKYEYTVYLCYNYVFRFSITDTNIKDKFEFLSWRKFIASYYIHYSKYGVYRSFSCLQLCLSGNNVTNRWRAFILLENSDNYCQLVFLA